MGKYSLYIGKLQNLPEYVKYSYYSSDSGYLLAYSDKEIRGMSKVPLENESRLLNAEKVWLKQCKMALNGNALKESKKEYLQLLSDFLDNFEKELIEAKKVKL
jgi:hypothetical protein